MEIYDHKFKYCPFSLQYKTKRKEIEPVKDPVNTTTAAPLTTTIMAVVKVGVPSFFMYFLTISTSVQQSFNKVI